MHEQYQTYKVGEILFNPETNQMCEVIEYVPEIEYSIFNNYIVKDLKTNKKENMSESYINIRFVTIDKLNKRIKNLLTTIDNCQSEISERLLIKEQFTKQLTLVERKES